jgi:hypothetical protein
MSPSVALRRCVSANVVEGTKPTIIDFAKAALCKQWRKWNLVLLAFDPIPLTRTICRKLLLLCQPALDRGRLDWAIYYARAFLYDHGGSDVTMPALQRRWPPAMGGVLLREVRSLAAVPLHGPDASSSAAAPPQAEAAAEGSGLSVNTAPAQADSALPRPLPYWSIDEDNCAPRAVQLLASLDSFAGCLCASCSDIDAYLLLDHA